ncbi:hypothetical protein GCK32_016755 [Trichostrongylus colubriformis]|uniref:Endonuclease n=1 Tax=Trichostrongylus colubriformis TaxID=6319 RepID=A0AAN8G0L9_TRICO
MPVTPTRGSIYETKPDNSAAAADSAPTVSNSRVVVPSASSSSASIRNESIKQLLAKFAVDIQRQILRQKAALETEGRWNTTNLLKSAKDYIAAELKIISQTERRTQVEIGILRSINAHDKRSFKESPKFQPRPCFYCGKPGHQARNCNEVSSLEQRLQVIRMQKLCQNCGEKDHMATKCPKGACRICGITGHHTSICKKLFSSQESPHGPHQGKTSKKTSTKSPTQAKPTSATVNTVTSDRKMDEDNKSNMVLHVSNTKDIFLLAGQAQVLNPFTQALEPVHVMLDTGADRSFISNELAQRLRLQDIDSKRLTITTFGSQTPMVKTCGVTVLQLWDANGAPHSFTVTRIDTVTKSLQRKRLCIEDKLFICDNNLQLSISPGTTDIRPQILLGCADLFSLLSSGLTPQHVLPSGLQLIPSKLGYLVAGRNECSSNDCGRPTYIRKPMEEWPEECKLFRLTNAEEENTHVSNMVSAEAQEELLDWRRQRSLLFSQNVVGYVLRFIKKLLNRVNTELRERVMKNIPQIRSAETLPYITAKEKEAALRVIIRNHQSVHLPTAKQLALKQLRIREDEDGLLRCQGRLGNASLQTDTRHPYLIASKTNLAQLIVKHAHTPLHCGTGHTMANVRERVWIPKLRQMVRTIIARCVPCQKLNNLPYRYPEMDDLPERRVRRSRPFEHIGIDYFGPLSVKRGEEPAKAYGIILTCATTRLVHLELVPDMSTNHLLLALRRFFARRGIPKSVTSDNGPNFLLGEQILREAVLPVVNDDSVPLDERIYEVFRCHQWDEFFEVEITSITDYGRKIKRRVIHLKPTIPIRVDNMIISLNTLTMPPTPELSSTFITDGSQIAMWNHGNSPTLICDSKEAARTLNCSLQSNCLCEPAEAKVNCLCSNLNITSVFESEVENRLPIRRPWLNFYAAKDDPSTVAATVPSLVTAELLVHLKDRFDKTVTKVTESVCKVNNAILQGCYSCPQGAIASITCFTNGEPTIASIRCHDHIFTTPCHHEGTSSTIIYSSEKARVHQECEVSCGTTITKFELTGVLQWTRTIHGTMKRIVNGESNVYDEIVLPDFLHIVDVMVTWYKTILIVAACLIIAIVISYIFFWTFGSRILMGGAKLLCRVIRGGTRLCLCIVCSPMKAVLRAWKERSLAKKRL